MRRAFVQVREFVVSHGAALQAELTALAAAAPQLSQQDCQQLEQQANELGRQLLALEAYVQLNQAGFVKIVKKHDKVRLAAATYRLVASPGIVMVVILLVSFGVWPVNPRVQSRPDGVLGARAADSYPVL